MTRGLGIVASPGFERTLHRVAHIQQKSAAAALMASTAVWVAGPAYAQCTVTAPPDTCVCAGANGFGIGHDALKGIGLKHSLDGDPQ
ncbi:hypothetical protein [Mesorhizobium loti]|uniref:Uncharacterized protein n=1 Tax=Mesorhizobium loti R88b TaxID=935548 RepID=A0A6M7WP88_RHILI|nr:hypothetical protein [Mesorhizobium loti]QKD00921.1 hypothetical protein EB235_04955 [Mesorhizobium loti R88b]